MEELIRANKVTAFWEGEGVATGVFYKTHDKVGIVKSDEIGFEFPVGTEEVPLSAQQKLEAFKSYITSNASTFGIQYDPVDRRADEFKFPNRYDESILEEYANKMAQKAISATLEKVQSNVIANMIKSGNVQEGTFVEYGLGEGQIEISELYKNEAIKYAIVTYPVVIAVAGKQVHTECKVQLVSGQLRKPRYLEDTVLTMSAMKEFLVENGLLPRIEKKSKKEEDAEQATEQATEE